MSDDRTQALRTVSLGIDAETFLASPLGRHIVAKAEDDIRTAVAELCVVDPHEVEKVRMLQNQVWRAESIQQWIAEAIQDGLHAEQIYIADE